MRLDVPGRRAVLRQPWLHQRVAPVPRQPADTVRTVGRRAAGVLDRRPRADRSGNVEALSLELPVRHDRRPHVRRLLVRGGHVAILRNADGDDSPRRKHRALVTTRSSDSSASDPRRRALAWLSNQVRIPVGGAGGSVTILGGGTGRAGKTAGSSTKRQSTSPSARAAVGARSPCQPSFQSASPTF